MTPTTSSGESSLLFDEGLELPQVLTHELDGDTVTLTVVRADVLACLDGDLSMFNELDELVGSAERLYRQTPPRRSRVRAHAGQLRRCALHARDIAQNTIAVLHRIRTAVVREPDRDDVLAAAAAAHALLHGKIGSDETSAQTFAVGALRLPSELDVWYDALTCQREIVTNLSQWLWALAHSRREDFTTDAQRLRIWVVHEPDLRAPDRLVDGPASPMGYVVHRHPRPAMPRMADNVAVGCDYETLTADQLTAVHAAVLAGDPPQRAAATASTSERALSADDVVSSAVRFGIWCQQSLLSGELHPWVVEALGLDAGTPLTRKGLRSLVRLRVSGGAEQASLLQPSDGVVWISSAWFDPALGGAQTPVRIFAALYAPAVGAWYQIVRGDVHDLLGYTPMRQVHYAALLGHVAAGGTLLDYAAQQGRRYRDVLDAWDRMVHHTHEVRDATTAIVDAVAMLPAVADPTNKSRITKIVRSVKFAATELGSPAIDTIGPAYVELMRALRIQQPAGINRAFHTLRSRLIRLVEHLLSNPLPADPALWNPEQIDTFYSRWPELTSTVVNGITPRAAAIGTIRTEVCRLVARQSAGAPATALELLTELHHGFGHGLRTAKTPRLQKYWQLWIDPGGTDEHVWRAFVDWPDIVTHVATAKQLAADAPHTRASTRE